MPTCGCGCGHVTGGGTYLPGHNSVAHWAAIDQDATFWSRLDKSGDCWIWTGRARLNYGYGAVRRNGRTIGAHRLAYQLHHGSIPAGMSVRHTCDNTACCNPAHLLLGSQSDNMKDAAVRGRMPRGMAHHRANAITHNGQTRSITEWSEITGITFNSLVNRLRRGWDVSRAL